MTVWFAGWVTIVGGAAGNPGPRQLVATSACAEITDKNKSLWRRTKITLDANCNSEFLKFARRTPNWQASQQPERMSRVPPASGKARRHIGIHRQFGETMPGRRAGYSESRAQACKTARRLACKRSGRLEMQLRVARSNQEGS